MLNNNSNTGLITERVINEEYAVENLTRIFPSSIILKSDFQILAVSEEIERIFKYSSNDLVGNTILLLIKHEFPKFQRYINDLSSKGFFISKPLAASDKFGEEVYVKISGFYLGLLSDMNDMLVILINDLSPIRRYKKRIRQREIEFNELVYRTHHEIKGPIATIKGLLNIITSGKSGVDNQDMIEMINQSINLLDSRITNISQFHELNSTIYENEEMIDLNKIEDEIGRILANYNKLRFIQFRIGASNLLSLNVNSDLIRKLLSYFIKAISVLTLTEGRNNLEFHFSKYNSNLRLGIRMHGFYCRPELRERLQIHRYTIEDAIKDDSALRFYIVHNYILNLDGKISYTFEDQDVIFCDIIIPL